jgi:large conductance mechanosensitive channel
MGILKEFKDFAVKGSVIDLAIGVIIGAAFSKIITSVVDDIIMPLINPVMPKGGWQQLVIYPGIKLGNFLSVVLNFVIIAFVLFLIVKAINRMRRREEASAPPTVPPTSTEILLMEIRDQLKQQNSKSI